MKTLELYPDQKEVECRTEDPVSSGLLALALDLPMACGGNGMCATCHVEVVEGPENLSPVQEREQRTLGLLSNCRPNSRLACQARLLGDVKVKVPEADFIQTTEELEAVVGKRASRDILHATDGRVLVKRGQIVTRYVIRKLKQSIG